MSAYCELVSLGALFSVKATALFQSRIVLFAVVCRLRVILLARFDFVQQWHRLLKQSPAKLQSALVDFNHFIAFWIDRVLHLADDRAIVNAWRDFVDGNAMLVLAVLERPVDG